MRDTADPVAGGAARVQATLQPWAGEPWRYDYFAVMRRLEASAQPQPRWGRALLPGAEAVRVGNSAQHIITSTGEIAPCKKPERVNITYISAVECDSSPATKATAEAVVKRM